VLIFSAISALFWYNEVVYHLPTPVPENYRPIGNGKLISLSGPFKNNFSKPVFLHFFNPDCPCSRFNIANFKSIVKQYGGQVNFMVVVVTTRNYTVKDIQNKFDLAIPVLFDAPLAVACGVYSTPQVALLDAQHKLYYRGNYNRNRYCADEKTSYAKIALKGLLFNHQRLGFNELALKAYGCKLAGCNTLYKKQ
jgi:hypothetical protein